MNLIIYESNRRKRLSITLLQDFSAGRLPEYNEIITMESRGTQDSTIMIVMLYEENFYRKMSALITRKFLFENISLKELLH